MQKAAWQELKKELGEGGAQCPALDQLTDKQLKAFTDILSASKKKQRATLNQAMEDALSHVPMLLRGAVRRIFL